MISVCDSDISVCGIYTSMISRHRGSPGSRCAAAVVHQSCTNYLVRMRPFACGRLRAAVRQFVSVFAVYVDISCSVCLAYIRILNSVCGICIYIHQIPSPRVIYVPNVMYVIYIRLPNVIYTKHIWCVHILHSM